MCQRDFDLDPSVLYLNHAAVSPWPRRTVEAVAAFARENGRFGSRHYDRWQETEQALREQLVQLINAADSEEIALLKNTSEALSVVAWGLDWQAGDRIVISDQEFPSNRIVWESLKSLGVEVIAVNLCAAETPEDALIGAIDERTRLLSVSSVQYATGLRLHLEILGKACRERGVLFCVDAIQSLGAVPFDVQACQADFVAADAHKWMLGPEGIALFYCRRGLINRLQLRQFGWHMVEAMGDFDRRDWTPAGSARRFECGSPNMLGIHALHASLGLILGLGLPAIYSNISRKISYLIELLKDNVSFISDVETGRLAGILSFRPPDADIRARYAHLQRAGVVCALRGGGIRFSPHYYTPDTVLERAVQILLEPL